MSNIINLPVSLGEAIDKLTILEIKLENIKDSRKLGVKNEYDILSTEHTLRINDKTIRTKRYVFIKK